MTNPMLPKDRLVELINEAEDEIVVIDPEFRPHSRTRRCA